MMKFENYLKQLLPLFVLFTAIACTEKEKDSGTYFGGKIRNPKSDFVVVHNAERAIDTIFLKEDNTFLGKLDSITEGLYYFKHGPEYQYIYLTPKDSLLIRLNTWDFDEDLVFSGTHAEENNALIDVFLQNEKDQKQFYSLATLPAEEFKEKTDSILAKKKAKISSFKTQNPETTDKFLDLFTIANTYPVYSIIENYIIEKQKDSLSKKIQHNLLSYRNNVATDIDSLLFFSPYGNYVMTKIYSDTYQQGHKGNSNDFTVALLKNIDKNIETEDLKNSYLRHATIRHFYNKSSCNINGDAFFTFFKLNSSIEDKKEVQRLLNDAKTLKKGNKLPDFKLTNYAGVTHNINDIAKRKNCVLYFRNPEHYSDEWVNARIRFLTNANPNVEFLVINLTDDKDYRVNNLDVKYQYTLPSKSIANDFVTSKYPRTVLVNNKGIIVNGFGALSSRKINKQIAAIAE